jgi:hypothetical protein
MVGDLRYDCELYLPLNWETSRRHHRDRRDGNKPPEKLHYSLA